MTECSQLERTHMLADGELAGTDAQTAREHLATCAECRAELADIVQLDLLVASARGKATNVVSLAWYRQRKVQIAAVSLAAAAAIAMLVLRRRPGSEPQQGEQPVQIALAPTRSLEARLAWGVAESHRPYDVQRAGSAREPIPLAALAALEQRADLHGAGVLALLDGDRARAATYFEKSGDTADVLADRAALALAEGAPDRALVLSDTALERSKGHAVATWNRALALRDLGLTRAAAAAFRDVAAKGERGWADEAKRRAAELDREADGRRDRAQRINAAMQTGALTADDVRAEPGLSQLVLYDLLRAEHVAGLEPLFAQLGPDAEATRKRMANAPRPALATVYAGILAGKPPTGDARAKYLEALRAAKADELLIGALIKLSPDGRIVRKDELPELARVAAASPDPWFQLLGLEQQAAVALADDDLINAEQLLLKGRARCAAGGAPAYRCTKIDTLLVDVYRNWQRIAEARTILADAWSRARRDNEWFLEIGLLGAFVNLAVLGDDATGSGVPTVRAYAEELRLRQPENCQTTVWSRVVTAMTLINRIDLDGAERELAAAPPCKVPLDPIMQTQHLFVRAHLVRERGTAEQLATLRADIALLRDDPATPANVAMLLDHTLGRALIDRDPAAAEPLLRRAITAAQTAPAADSNAHKARSWSYAVLAIAAARRGDANAALALLAEEQGTTVPDRCVVGLAVDDKRRIVVARDAAGKAAAVYAEDRVTAAIDPAHLVPPAVANSLAACDHIAVIARSPIHGSPQLFGDDVAWSYHAAHSQTSGKPSDKQVVVADVEPPASLGLPRLATWSSDGERISGPAATPSRVLAAIGDAGVVTIHAHGLVDLGRPDASFLALSPDAGGRYALTAGDVDAAHFATSPVVILAACRASQAAPVMHEPWSLPSAFVHAGARAVIASASPIPDGDAAAFFDRVRARITAGASVAIAVRDVRRDWLAERRGSWVRDVIVFE